MLVLTRKSQQQIRIGNDVVVTVLRIKGNQVRIGIEAPRSTRVVRTELDLHIDSLGDEDAPSVDENEPVAEQASKPSANRLSHLLQATKVNLDGAMKSPADILRAIRHGK